MKEAPAFPKPSDIKSAPVAVRVYKGGREKCNLLTKAGRAEYQRRKRVMWERQGRVCCLEGRIPECPGKLDWEDCTFDHEVPRGYGGSTQDDRIEIDGKWRNGAAHYVCNGRKGSQRINYNETLQPLQPFYWHYLPDKTTPSGKALFRCTKCGFETPAPTKMHQCGSEHN